MTMSIDNTTKVYGRSSASLTIHMVTDHPNAQPHDFDSHAQYSRFRYLIGIFFSQDEPAARVEQSETTAGVSPKLRQIHPEKRSGVQPAVSLPIECDPQAIPKRNGAGKAHIDTRGLAPTAGTRRSTRPHAPWRCNEDRDCHIYRNARKTETAARRTRRRSVDRSYGISTGAGPRCSLQNPWLRGASNGGTAHCGT